MIMIKNTLNFKKGFTLVELMVVISIIGILSAVVYANFSDARKVARDEIRKTDLKNLQLAIELFKAQNGRYPDGCKGNDAWSGGSNAPGVGDACNAGVDYIVGLVPDYISELPEDPSNPTSGNIGYLYKSEGGLGAATAYKLMAHQTVEKVLIKSYDDEFARCPDGGGNCPVTFPSNNLGINNTYAVYKGSTSEND